MTEKDETLDLPPNEIEHTIPDGHSDTIDGGELELNLLANRYAILDQLGEGGMGTVYRARDVELDEIVAVKMLHPRVVSNPRARLLFRREVKLARRVTHKNVARTFDLQIADNQVFLTMEFVDGWTLRDELRKGPLDVERVAELAIEICHGLGAAHGVGVIHRDLKPDNVMIDDTGRVVLTDFGIAAQSGQDATGIAGTPHYISPEQARSVQVTERSDIYSFGIVLWELLMGYPPFDGNNPMNIIMKRMVEPLPELSETTPETLREIIKQCLALNPDDRYSSIERVLFDLQNSSVSTDRFTATNFTASEKLFMGRSQEFDDARDAIAAGRDVVVTGVGGVGKTEFVNVLGSRLLASFAGRVWDFDLSSTDAVTDVLSVVCAELGLKAGDKSETDVVDQIAQMLETESSLVLLHSVEGEAAERFVSELQRRLKKSVIVCTTRRSIRLQNALIIRLRGLCQEDAVQLFVQSAELSHGRKLARDSFVEQIVKSVDQIPLAIELLAARTRFMSPEVLVGRLTKNPFELARSTSTELEERHQSLSHVVSTSWDMLSDNARTAAKQTSVLRAPVEIDALFAVIETDGIPENLIEELWEYNFLEWDEDRFFLVRTVSDFAAHRAKDDLLDRARLRLGSSIVERNREFGKRFRVLASANTTVALEAAIRNADEELAAGLLDALRMAAERHGPLSMLSSWCERLLEKWPNSHVVKTSVADAQRWINPDFSLRICDALLGDRSLSAESRAVVLRIEAECNIWRGNFAKALHACTESVQISEEISDDALLGDALKFRGIVLRKLGRIEDGIDALTDAVSIYKRIRNDGAVAMATGNLATLYYDAGDLEKAERLTDFAAKTCARLGLRLRASVWNSNLGSIQIDQERFEESIETFKRSLLVQETVGDPRSLALTHHNLSLSYQYVDLAKSEHHLARSQELSEPLEIFDVVHMNETHRANLYAMTGRGGEALKIHAKVIDALRQSENVRMLASALLEQSLDASRLGEFDLARIGIEELQSFSFTEMVEVKYILVRAMYYAYSQNRELALADLERAEEIISGFATKTFHGRLRSEIRTKLELET